jgi:hypothetical protein
VFQAVALSIALTLAVGQNAALLCRSWCDTHAAAASECHHETSSDTPSVVGSERCDSEVLGAAAVLRQDMRRGVSPTNADHAVAVPRYQLDALTTGARPGQEPGRECSLDKRPLSTALRI